MAKVKGPSGTVIRPHLVVLVGWIAILMGIFVLMVSEVRDGLHSVDDVSALFMSVVAAIGVAMALRERVEVDGSVVRIVRLISIDELPRSEVVAVVRAGGIGNPTHLQLRSPRETSGRYFDLTKWPPRRRVRAGPGVRYPGFIGASRLGRGLGIPVLTWGAANRLCD